MAKRTNRSNDKQDTKATRQAKSETMPDQADVENRQSTLEELNELESEAIEDEIGLEEVDIDAEDLNAIAAEENSEELSGSSINDGFDNELDEEVISDQPQETTQSYGTGLQGKPTDRSGRRAHLNRSRYFNEADATLTGGDIDANYEQANAVGDESVGGTVVTPDQDIVDDLGKAVGMEVDDRTFLRTNDTMEERDDRRWELDPKSSEDYQERRS